jgi:hypothetical protein
MSKQTGGTQAGVSEAIRAEIAKIPAGELPAAKPARVLPGLETAGFEITPSVRSTTSKLLAKAKNEAGAGGGGEVISVADAVAAGRASEDRRELAMRLVEACGGDFGLARSVISRLEQFYLNVRGG